ncbi:MAG: phage/plasmid primase, P4 family [Bacillota bacterium]
MGQRLQLTADDEKLIEGISLSENLTDMGNSRRLVMQVAGNCRFLADAGKWIIWTGKRWEIDKTGAVMRQARDAVRRIYNEAAVALDENERKAIAKHAIRSESENRIKSMVSLTQTEPEIPIRLDELDRDIWLLNCLNGTINLTTGRLHSHRRDDFITKLCPVEYKIEARSELLDSFLERVLPDAEVRRYVQKALGYTLTGDTGLEKLFFAYGPPATGKSTLLSAVESVMGDYAVTADFESFLQRDRVTGAARNDIARLAGRRFVLSVEVEDGRKLAESLVNQLTGGDTIAARFLYSESFEFKPQFKLWLAANNRPKVSGPESAIWRRMVQVPFLETIPENERDPAVKSRLRTTERAALLAWLVSGCLLWQKEGLLEPRAVKHLTDDYREESDVLKDFFQECCLLEPTAQASNTQIWRAYQDWCKANGERYPLGRKRFTQALFSRGLDQYQTGANRVRTWVGVGLLNR